MSTQLVPQRTRPGKQNGVQTPLEQTGNKPLQLCPHPPQLFGSLFVLTQLPPHFVKPKSHEAAVQTPLLQPGVPLGTAAQTWPQAPQLLGSLPGSTQLPLERHWPVGQVYSHAPLTQADVPPTGGQQMFPQPPQLLTSPNKPPLGQTHRPFTQVASLGQAWPQAPQLFGSLLVPMQLPPHFVRPGLQPNSHMPLLQKAMPPLGEEHPL
jgi:hypothetical protein